MTRMFQMPAGCVGTCVKRKRHWLFLLCPNKMGGSFSGEVVFNEIQFTVPRSNKLIIFKVTKKGDVEQVL